MLKVTLTKSPIKAPKHQRETIRGLGLRKLQQSRIVPDTPEIRGMIKAVDHLIKYEVVKD